MTTPLLAPGHKTVKAELIKATDEGSVEAVIATFDEIDSDGDVVLHGAFEDSVAPIMPAHDHGSVQLGKAHVEERGQLAVLVGKFNLKIESARDWFQALKFDLANPPTVQQWSWGYHPITANRGDLAGEPVRFLAKLDITEFSPVLRGASVGTRTLFAKAVSERHKTETSDAAWDVSANVLSFKGENVSDLYAFVNEDARAFPHHFVSEDGEVKEASTRACLAYLSSINRGACSLYGESQRSIYDHLAGHLEDAGIKAPEFKRNDGLKLIDQIHFATWDVEAAVIRLRAVKDQRVKRGHLSQETIAEALNMSAAFEEMRELSNDIEELVKQRSFETAVSRAIAAYEKHKARAALAG